MTLQSYTDPYFLDDLTTITCKDDLIALVDCMIDEWIDTEDIPDTPENRAKLADFLMDQLVNLSPGEIVNVGMIYARATND